MKIRVEEKYRRVPSDESDCIDSLLSDYEDFIGVFETEDEFVLFMLTEDSGFIEINRWHKGSYKNFEDFVLNEYESFLLDQTSGDRHWFFNLLLSLWLRPSIEIETLNYENVKNEYEKTNNPNVYARFEVINERLIMI